tara:strand:+ start:1461 stop:1583 length:123 start_codon:yes stop_codon:yes gene_type:complete
MKTDLGKLFLFSKEINTEVRKIDKLLERFRESKRSKRNPG